MADQDQNPPVTPAQTIDDQAAQDLPATAEETLSPADKEARDKIAARMFNAVRDPDYVDPDTGVKASNAAKAMFIIQDVLAKGKQYGLDIKTYGTRNATLLMELANTNSSDPEGYSKRSLYEKDTADLARMLIREGVEVNFQDEDGDSAINIAAGGGNPELKPPLVLQEILKAPGAKADLPNKDGETALIQATTYTNTPAAAALLAGGANPDATIALDGSSVLQNVISSTLTEALPKQKEAFVALLLEYHASVDGDLGNRAFFGAARAGSTHMMEQLIAAGYQFDPFATIQGEVRKSKGSDVKDEKGNRIVATRTLWDEIINESTYRINANPPKEDVEWFLEHRKHDIRKRRLIAEFEGNIFYIDTPDHKPPPLRKVELKLDSAQYLLDRMPNSTPEEKARRQKFLDLPGQQKRPPLLASVHHGGDSYNELTRLLLREGADIHAVGEDGNGALHEAILKEADQTVADLLDVKTTHDEKNRSIDIYQKNKAGVEPLTMAQSLRQAKQQAHDSIKEQYQKEGRAPKDINAALIPYEESMQRLDNIIGKLEDERRDPQWLQWHKELEAERKQREQKEKTAMSLPKDLLRGVNALRDAQATTLQEQETREALAVVLSPQNIDSSQLRGLSPRRNRDGIT